MSNSAFFSKKKTKLIFFLTLIFFVILLSRVADSYYNKFSDFLAEKTNNTIILPKIKESPFRLGLDLQGGVQLIYQADVSQISDSDKDDLLEGVKDIIERRVNAFGVSEPLIQVNKTLDGDHRVIVELAGVKSIDEAIKEIGETPRLEFKEQDLDSDNLKEDDLKLLEEYNLGAQEKISELYQKLSQENEDFAQIALEHNTPLDISSGGLSLGAENDGDLGWINSENNPNLYSLLSSMELGDITEIIEDENGFSIFKIEESRPREDSLLISSGEKELKVRHIFIEKISKEDLMAISENWKNTELSGKNLKKAVLNFNPNDGSPEVSLEFDEEGAKLFEEITARNIGKPVAIYLDDYPISVPFVNEKIEGGRAVISGKFNVKEAKELVQRLKTGALPVPIKLINQKVIGASLGNQSIKDSFKAGIIGLILVALFMIIVYRLPGLMSIFALLVYGAMVLTIFKVLPIVLAIIVPLFFLILMLLTFEELKILDITFTLLFVIIAIILLVYGLNAVTLTLAGIAGFILSIGMAVDANVLIFERIKEEIRLGRDFKSAIDESIRKAWPSIRDGNISTLLICVVLMSFGTGALKGFGTTLFVGVSASMFSAIVITRNFLTFFLSGKIKNNRFLLGLRKEKVVEKNWQ